MNKEDCLKWFHRGVEHGRQQTLEGLLTALGLDTHEFKPMPVSEIETEKWFDHFRTMDVLREQSKKPQLSPIEDEFSKHKFTITFSSTNVDDRVVAQCQELGVWAEGNGKQAAFDKLRVVINAKLARIENAKNSDTK